jgi:hypothetical protein
MARIACLSTVFFVFIAATFGAKGMAAECTESASEITVSPLATS